MSINYYPFPDADYLFASLGYGFFGGGKDRKNDPFIDFRIGGEFDMGRQLWGWGRSFVDLGYFYGWGEKENRGCFFGDFGYSVYNASVD